MTREFPAESREPSAQVFGANFIKIAPKCHSVTWLLQCSCGVGAQFSCMRYIYMLKLRGGGWEYLQIEHLTNILSIIDALLAG